ncbi:T9SS type A sorting domain-containing protein [Chryseobacterium sp. MYb264]|uniref:T9SS type A sorting domain-containing protein n=1 Tax=Chryseobacterium sp. MYb264 TaxID=2745153 RepID=UPI002E1477F9|nr:T9SS type A sorting domain-containing protein [Chryseobacterium sp. MYb264]
MRKSLFAIGLLAAIGSVQAQNVLLHVDDAATTYVSKGTLVYNGGGLQMRGNGVIENHGNIMVSGSTTDSFKTITTGGTDKPEGSVTANFVNRLNEPDAYSSAGVSNNYTYGQLYIAGIPQNNITGIVDQELRATNHGSYQQIGLPFYDKTASTLSTELGKTFTNVRNSKNEILSWNNATVVSQNVPITTKLGVGNPGTAYYMLGGNSLDLTTTKIVKGRPVSDESPSVLLTNAGSNVTFGTNGNNVNQYNEKYNTYLQDGWDSPGGAWSGTYGKNIYQYANPYLTNLDLSKIAFVESGVGDGNNLTTIKGVRVDVVDVVTNAQGTGSTSYKFISFAGGEPIGDVEYTLVRPMGTFVVKLNDNTATGADATLNIGNLRRFNYTPRTDGTDYNVAAAKNGSNNSVKQLGVIGLDANGKEVGRTYYVVYPNATTGHSTAAKSQVSAVSANVIGTFEEAPSGGYDYNYAGQYWLYINEANESNFKGKNIKLANYDLNKIKSYKFEVRENANLIDPGVHALSSGIGFFYKAQNGTVQEIKQGDVFPATTGEADLYYGEPDRVLATKPVEATKPSRTMVVYNPEITDYVVRFDPNWKKADIEVYDMSGKLVISKKAVDASTDFVIELSKAIKASYVVKIVSDKGETVNTKILK